MTSTKTTVLSFALLLACATDPGDVGSSSNATTGADGGGSSMGTATSSAAGTQTDGGTSTSASGDPGTDSDPASSSSATQASESGSEASSTASSSGDGDSGTTGTAVADCSECGPDQGCVGEVAFGVEYFCVPWPADCDAEFDCACAAEYCVDPFTACVDLPDPPQRTIHCECISC